MQNMKDIYIFLYQIDISFFENNIKLFFIDIFVRNKLNIYKIILIRRNNIILLLLTLNYILLMYL